MVSEQQKVHNFLFLFLILILVFIYINIHNKVLIHGRHWPMPLKTWSHTQNIVIMQDIYILTRKNVQGRRIRKAYIGKLYMLLIRLNSGCTLVNSKR